ncbi:protein kinase domain-containing protein [Streptomyces sp. NPDC054871]
MTTELAPEDPERLGGYWLAARLGAGGQGVVYEAYDAHGARVALKALHRGAEPFVRERFGREAVAARRVASFCTARVLDASADEDTGTPFIVSEYVSGPTLAEEVYEKGPLGVDALTRLATGAATALAAIHSADVVHRDLKPGNVLLGPDGPRIIDFGIARAPDMSQTATGKIMGTFGYMAPEVLSGQRATEASDIFAWAAVVVYAASGTEPFRGAHIGEVIHRTAALDPDLSALPNRMRPLVAAALAKEPDLRPSAQELLLGLVGKLPKSADPRNGLLEAGVRRAAVPGAEADRAAGRPATDVVPPLGERADAAFGALPPDVQLAAQQLLLRLVVPGDADDGSQDAVRIAGRAELCGSRPESEQRTTEAAIDGLIAAGALVSADEDGSVRPVSAALIPAWARLREWVAADRAALAVHRRLGRAALSWETDGERGEDLLRGTSLQTGLDWLATAPFQLRPNPLELRFLTASRAESVRAARRRRQLLSSLAVLTALALLAGTFAWFQSRESRRNGEEADRRRAQATARSVAQAADNLRGDQPDTALLLSLASWRIAQIPESRSALNSGGTQRETAVIGLPTLRSSDENSEKLLDGGRTLMQHTPGTITFWDLAKGPKGASEPRLTVKGTALSNDVPELTTSPDGRLLLLVGKSETDPYRIVSTRDGKPVGKPVKPQAGYIPEQLSDKGQVLFAEDEMNRIRDYRLLDQSGNRTAEWTTSNGVTLSPDGTHYATCVGKFPDSYMEVWSAGSDGTDPVFTTRDDGKQCARDISFSADGARVGLGGGAGTFAWKTATGEAVGSTGVGEDLESPSLSADGRHVVGLTEEDTVQIWSLGNTRSPLFRFVPRRGSDVSEVGYDARTKTLVYLTGSPHQVHRLDVASALSSDESGQDVESAAVSSNGRVVVFREGLAGISGEGGDEQVTQHLRDPRTGKEFADPVPQHLGPGQASENRISALSADGRYLAFTDFKSSGDGDFKLSISVWDTRSHKELIRVPVPGGRSVSFITVAPDGRHVSYLHQPAGTPAPVGSTSEVWNVRARKRVHTYEKSDAAGQFSHDSRRFVTVKGDVLDLATGSARRTDFGSDEAVDLVFSPDGKHLAVVKDTGWVELWDSKVTGRRARMPSSTVRGASHGGESMRRPVVSPDGTFLATIVDANSVQLWDLDSRLSLGDPLELMGRDIDALAFDSDGVLRTLSGDRSQSLDLTPDRLAATVCKKAGRDITREEWRTYVPDEPYRSLC